MRKTNLFYLTDNESNFLTFSNYGEYLTGVSLATNYKIYPSSFICLTLPFDSEHTLDKFKQFLMCYYENKLAYLRDQCDINNEKMEDKLHPFSYLLKSIYLFFNITENFSSLISYYGDIVEHDYNGTYSDSICIVDFNRHYTLDIKLSEDASLSCIESTNLLYGWNNDEVEGLYNNDEISLKGIFDSYTGSNYGYNLANEILFYKVAAEQTSVIEFNCIIPLFDINNISTDENNYNINEDTLETQDIYQFIPYGIWFATNTSGENDLISLQKRSDNISQSWSLVISSKFAPYPYGIKVNDTNIQKDIEKYTYAELLAEQSKILEKYNDLSSKFVLLSDSINKLATRIDNLEQINFVSSSNIKDIINNYMQTVEKELNKKMENIEQHVDDCFVNLKWKDINTSSIVSND